ncbi:hypothetical protein HYU89_04605 [Candidatus Collierbacteria bacterium]|nr:hypothetical protein [Candidatus Collierbacteria bacterium]
MITPQTQIKVNLPVALWEFLASKAAKYDLPISGYVRHLVIKDVSPMDFPVFEMSDRTKKILKKALKDRHKAVAVDDVSKFFETL